MRGLEGSCWGKREGSVGGYWRGPVEKRQGCTGVLIRIRVRGDQWVG